MAWTAAFRWDISKRQISYMICDASSLQIVVGPVEHKGIGTIQDAHLAIGAFVAALNGQAPSGIVEYHVLNSGAPWQTRGTVNPLSAHILNALPTGVTAGTTWKLAKNQLRGELKGTSLRTFKSAMRAWGFTTGARGRAWEVHLFAVALHATASDLRKIIRTLWENLNRLSARKGAGRQRFLTWYAQL